MCVTLNSLRLFRELHLRGGVLRVHGEIVAFTVGEPVSEDTFVVHIEKGICRSARGIHHDQPAVCGA